MTVFVIALLIAFILPAFLWECNGKKKNKLIYLFIVFTFLSVIAGLRDITVGIDSSSYYREFTEFKYTSLYHVAAGSPMDIGYILYSYFIYVVLGNIQGVFLFSAILTSAGFGYWIYRNSRNVVVSVLLYIVLIFPVTMNIMRQSMAISFVLLEIVMICDKKLPKAVIFQLLAVCFHMSSAIFLPLLLLAIRKKKIDRKILILGSVAGIIGLVFGSKLIFVFIRIFPRYAQLLRYSNFTRGEDVSVILLLGYTLIGIISFVLLMLETKNKRLNREMEIICFIMFAGFYVCYYLSKSTVIVQRIKYYFIAGILVLVPYIMGRFLKENKLSSKVVYVMTNCLLVGMGVYFFKQDGQGLLPYIFGW